ncbi:uncharacterized protein OCT59_014203 [Rhizophagus irregularis]|nr:hypothetical protein OCT59_014203 [Rhizophagus irregularis]GBC13915.1 hypothetical protein GLOIN_2v1592190 [Rhizophagus irregularis DAOM 181602=DAOM 197198]
MIPEIPKYYTTKERSSLRRSLRIQRRDDRRRCEELERRALEEMRAQAHVPKRLTKQPIKRPTTTSTLSQTSSKRSKKKKVYHDLSQTNTTSRLLSMPLDLLLYLLEFLGPSLAAMERASKSLYHIIRGQHSPYRFLYYKLLATYNPIDECAMETGEQPERAIHAPVLPKIRQSVVKQESREFKVSDWKVQFVESYKYYVTEVCTVCGEPGDPIPVWEVRLCRFCVVRQLINKSALYAFTLSSKEIEMLKPWKTYVYDLGMNCTFYLRNHLDHLRRQKYSDPQSDLDRDVEQRQSEKFAKENFKRKRKQKEQEESYNERTQAILRCFRDSNLKEELSVMEEWWFPKELKLEIHEYISNKTNNSLARKRLRLSTGQDSNDDITTPSNPQTKSKALRKNLEDIMFELQTVVVPRVKRLMELNRLLLANGISIVDKLRMELDLKTRRFYDEFILGGGMSSPLLSSQNFLEYPLTVARTCNEILLYFNRENMFESSLTRTWCESISQNNIACCEADRQRFLRDAKEWWARRGKKPPPEKCGELYLARVRKRQIWLKNDMSLTRTQENWRRQLLERKLREKIDWYFTDLPKCIKELRNIYENNLKRRMKNSEIYLMKGISSQIEMLEPPERLKSMYCDYEDFIKDCNGFCSTEDGYCGCLEYAAKDIIRANTILRRKEWMNAELKKCKTINFQGPDLLLCTEAKEEYQYATRNISVPKRAALEFIIRAETFMQKLLREVSEFAPELITSEAREWYKRCLGTISDFYKPPRRPCTWTAYTTNCFYYEVNNLSDRPDIDETIEKIKECERIRNSRLKEVDRAATEAKLNSTYWNIAMIKRPTDGVTFQTRVRWITTNGWFTFNQLAQAWVYDEERSPLSHLEPYIKEKVKHMEKEIRKEDIASRIKDHPEYQAIFTEIDEDADFFLRDTYEISTIYKVSNLYKAHVEDVKPGIDPDKVVRQVIDLIRDVKTGVISKSSLFVADRERFAEEDDDDDDNVIVGNVNNRFIIAIGNNNNNNGNNYVAVPTNGTTNTTTNTAPITYAAATVASITSNNNNNNSATAVPSTGGSSISI